MKNPSRLSLFVALLAGTLLATPSLAGTRRIAASAASPAVATAATGEMSQLGAIAGQAGLAIAAKAALFSSVGATAAGGQPTAGGLSAGAAGPAAGQTAVCESGQSATVSTTTTNGLAAMASFAATLGSFSSAPAAMNMACVYVTAQDSTADGIAARSAAAALALSISGLDAPSEVPLAAAAEGGLAAIQNSGVADPVLVLADLTAATTVAQPTASPASGTYTAVQSVTLSSATSGASIYYTTDGSTPTATPGELYSPGTPISVATSEEIQAFAIDAAWTPSSMLEASYTIDLPPAAPIFTPYSATPLTSNQAVNLALTTPLPAGLTYASYHYTEDGSTPTCLSTAFPAMQIGIPQYGTTVFKVVACGTVGNASLPTTTTFIRVNTTPVLAPTFSQASGSFGAAFTTTFTQGDSPAIGSPYFDNFYYTTDGTQPNNCFTGGSTMAGASAAIAANTTTVKVVACDTNGQASPAGTAVYTYVQPVSATPTIAPAGGSFATPQSVILSSTTSGAVIYYTTDGSVPTPASSVYVGPLSIVNTGTLKAIAVAAGDASSGVASAAFTMSVTDPAVTLTLLDTVNGINGTCSVTGLNLAVSVSFLTSDSFTTPCLASGTFHIALSPSNPFPLNAAAGGGSFSLVGFRVGVNIDTVSLSQLWSASHVLVTSGGSTLSNYTSTPSFSITTGTYISAQTVTISADSGATVYYTTNGGTPTTASSVYTTPITVAVTETLSAMAVKAGYTNSSIHAEIYTITGTVGTPTFSPVAGTYTSTQSVAISSDSGASIYYTLDGSTPTTGSSLYLTGSPISVAASKTIKALATKTSWANSAVATAAYTITGTVGTPTFSPVAGTYTSTQSVALSSDSGASIYYTLDGSTPTTGSSLYVTGSPISVATSKTIRALATKATWANSAVATAAYTINLVTGPTVPTALILSPQPASVAMSWTAPAGGSATVGYLVARRTNSVTPFAPTNGSSYSGGPASDGISTIVMVGNATAVTDANLPGSGTYDYSVYAYDASLNYSPVLFGATTTQTAGFAGGQVLTLAEDSAGRMVVGGTFSAPTNNIARLYPSGVLDTSFAVGTGVNNTVYAVAVDSVNNKVYISGSFTTYNGVNVAAANGGSALIRLNSNGSLDTAFQTGMGNGASGAIRGLAVDSARSRLYIMGGMYAWDNFHSSVPDGLFAISTTSGTYDESFISDTAYGSDSDFLTGDIRIDQSGNVWMAARGNTGGFNSGSGMVACAYICKIQPNGTVDATFSYAPFPTLGISGPVDHFVLDETNGYVYAATYSQGAVRLSISTGAVDTTFGSGGLVTPVAGVNSVALDLASNSFFLGGNFNLGAGHIQRIITSSGSIDSAFAAGSGFTPTGGSSVINKLLTSQNHLYSAGNFTQYNGKSASYVARITTESIGTPVPSFAASSSLLSTSVYTMKKDAKGRTYVATTSGTGLLTRLLPTGANDSTFAVGTFGAGILAIAIDDAGGKVYVAGNFASYNGTAVGNLIRLNAADGSLDLSLGSFDALSAPTYMEFDSIHGHLIVEGAFTKFNGVTIPSYLAAFRASDGVRDTSMNFTGAMSNNSITDMHLDQATGLLYVASNFTYLGQSCFTICRILSTGALDSTFIHDTNNAVGHFAIGAGTDGIYYDDQNLGGVGEMSKSGVWNSTFPGPGNSVNGGSDFLTIQVDQSRPYVYVGAWPANFPDRMMRVSEATGTDDTNFVQPTDYQTGTGRIYTIMITGDQILSSGTFTSYRGNTGMKYMSAVSIGTQFGIDYGFNPNSAPVGQ